MTLGLGIASALGPEVGAAVAPEVERLGYATFWTTDGGNVPGLPVLAAAQKVTRGMRLGVNVIPADARPAEAIARSIDELGIDVGRVIIGVGSGRSEHRLATVRSAVEELRTRIGPRAVIGIAALGPLMCRLAGEIADVVMPNWMTPARIEWVRRRVAEGERRAGRPPGTVRVAMYVRVAIGADATERLSAEAGRYARSPSYARHFADMGVEPGQVGIASTDGSDVASRLEPYRRVLDETIVRALPKVNEAEEVLRITRAGIA